MIKVLLWVWQLPQHILGLIVILVTRATKYVDCYIIRNPDNTKWFGVSLGQYVIFGNYPDKVSKLHESGHSKQSAYLGPLYLLIIGLPSFIFNIADRLLHRNWQRQKRELWYYSLPWEAWADELGGVVWEGDLEWQEYTVTDCSCKRVPKD